MVKYVVISETDIFGKEKKKKRKKSQYSGKQIVQVYGLTSEKLKLLTDAEFAELEFTPD